MGVSSAVIIAGKLPLAISAVTLAVTALIAFGNPRHSGRRLAWTAGVLGAFVALYPFLLSVLQYLTWAGHPFTEILLRLPLDPAVPLPAFFEPLRGWFERPGGYFAFYSIGRFFLQSAVTLLFAVLWGSVALLASRFFDSFPRRNALLIVIALLSAGWPMGVLFVGLLFLCWVAYEGACRIQKKEDRNFGIPVAMALSITVICGASLMRLFHLGVLAL